MKHAARRSRQQGMLCQTPSEKTLKETLIMENDGFTPNVEPAPVPEPAPTADTQNRLSAARQFAAEQYEKLRHAASVQARNVRQYTDEARQQINAGWDKTCTKAKDLHQAGEDFVKTNPTGSVLGALGLGVIVGLLLGASRR